MVSFNIFELIHELFKVLFIPFKWLRITLAQSEDGWWYSNIINFFCVCVLIAILSWWVSMAVKFKREGKEDCA